MGRARTNRGNIVSIIRYATALRVDPTSSSYSTLVYMVFDLNGHVVMERELTPNLKRYFRPTAILNYFCPLFSMGQHLFGGKINKR